MMVGTALARPRLYPSLFAPITGLGRGRANAHSQIKLGIGTRHCFARRVGRATAGFQG